MRKLNRLHAQKRQPGEFRPLMLGRHNFATRDEFIEAMAALNVHRIQWYVKRLGIRLRSDVALRQIKLKARRQRRAEAAAARR